MGFFVQSCSTCNISTHIAICTVVWDVWASCWLRLGWLRLRMNLLFCFQCCRYRQKRWLLSSATEAVLPVSVASVRIFLLLVISDDVFLIPLREKRALLQRPFATQRHQNVLKITHNFVVCKPASIIQFLSVCWKRHSYLLHHLQ